MLPAAAPHRAALREYGFLAWALQKCHPDQDQYQVDVLYQLLIIMYPQPAATPGQDLSRGAIQQILSGTTGPPPTPALLCAVLMLLHRPESRELAWAAYVHGSLTRPNFNDRTRAYLYARLPSLDVTMIGAPELRPEDRARMDEDMIRQVPGGPHH